MPKWSELKRYCEKDGWELYKNTDHYYYRKYLKDGTILRTKVSKGSGEIGQELFKRILSKQLKTDKEHFNDVIHP